MSTPASHGACTLCGKRTTKAGMSRHLAACLETHEPTAGGKPTRLLRMRVEGYDSPMFWMDLEMQADAPLGWLDTFLREIWLECCGHLSSFTIGGTEYMVSTGMMDGDPWGDTRDMDVAASRLLNMGSEFRHLYDFGTSTELKLRVTGERQGVIGNRPVRLLSRNEEPEWGCEVCGEAATDVCTECMWDKDNPFFCAAHAAGHGCDDEMLLPVVNSPRMGMCAYTGPV